jgi:hypothetical protein
MWKFNISKKISISIFISEEKKIPNVANCQTIFSLDENQITLNLGWVLL